MEPLGHLLESVEVDKLLTSSAGLSERLIGLLKGLYDASIVRGTKSFGPFDSLTVEGMDMESLWEQLQTRSRPTLRFAKKKAAILIKTLKDKQIQNSRRLSHDADGSDDAEVDGGSDSGSVNSESESSEEKSYLENDEKENEDDDDDDDDNDDDDGYDVRSSEMEDGSEDGNSSVETRNRQTAPDDEDFLEKMNAWLDEAEDREGKIEQKRKRMENLRGQQISAEDYDEESEEEDEFFVQRELYEDDGEEAVADYTYADYFLSERNSTKEKSKSKGLNRSSVGKQIGYQEELGSEEDEEEEEQEEENEGDDDSENDEYDYGEDHIDSENEKMLTSHERHKQQLASQIKDIEAELVGPKSWDLRGEVKGSDRPENSLLGITADIERASKPAPIVTQEYTSTLEDMIRQRIKDANFDDVTPPPVAQRPIDGETSNELFLSQEKDRTGLGDIYAQEFLAKSRSVTKSGAEANKEEIAVLELKHLYHRICRELDALSHFHYSPRPAISEASVTSSSVPSISLEDITPAAMSAGTAAAPEEVHEKQRGRAAALLSEAELTSDDRKRLRRASKSTRRKKLKVNEAQEVAASKEGKASKSFENKKLDEALRADSRVIRGAAGDPEQNSYSKSSTFFASLQRQSQKDINGQKVSGSKRTKSLNPSSFLSSSKIKL